MNSLWLYNSSYIVGCFGIIRDTSYSFGPQDEGKVLAEEETPQIERYE